MDENRNAIKCETVYFRTAIVNALQGFTQMVKEMPPEKKLINEK
jgi:hypothetical protein